MSNFEEWKKENKHLFKNDFDRETVALLAYKNGYSQCKKDAGEAVEELPVWADIYEATDEIEKLEPK